VVSDGPPTFEVSEIWKGKKQSTHQDGAYYLQFAMPAKVRDLLDRDTSYVLFLSEKGLKLTPSSPIFQPITSGEGIVIADDVSLKAVRGALKAKPK
jgi:hypothetical protein